MATRRIFDPAGPIGSSTINELSYCVTSGASKEIHGLGVLSFLTKTSEGVAPAGNWVAVFVNQATPGFVLVNATTGGSAPTAPGANVVPCTPYDWTVFCVGENTFLVPDASTNTAIYLIPDSGLLTTVPGHVEQ